MESLIELWYLNYAAIFATIIALGMTGYIWYDSQNGPPATNWLIMGGLGVLLTIPASWTTFNFSQADKQILQSYLDNVRNSPEVVGQSIAQILEALARQLSITETVNLDYDNLEMFLFLSLAGLIVSAVASLLYNRNKQSSFDSRVSPLPATYQLPPTDQYGPPPPVTAPPTVMPTTSAAPVKTGQTKDGSPPLEHTRLINEPPQTVAWLVRRDGSRQGKGYPLGRGETLIGRDGQRCQIILDQESISGQHAKIKMEQKSFWLYDLASTNGTYLNEQRIQRQRLEDGDKIRLGELNFTFKEVR